MAQQTQVDVAAVVRKLQERLGEALTTIAILETQIDQLNAPEQPADPEVVTPEVVN